MKMRLIAHALSMNIISNESNGCRMIVRVVNYFLFLASIRLPRSLSHVASVTVPASASLV